jgi:hypothetical protein
MKQKFDDLPNWIFELIEVSAGVYRIKATDTTGRSFEKTGTDPDALIEEGKNYANKF